MAVDYQQDTTSEVIKTYDHWKACGGHTETSKTVQSSYRTTSRTIPEGRTKPDPPLWRYQTALGPNWTKESHNCLIRNQTWYEQVCNDGNTYPGVITSREMLNADFFPSSIPKYNWAMELRNRIKDAYLNIGVDIVEIRETANMFTTNARRLHDAWRSFRRGRRVRRGGSNPLGTRDVAAAELEIAFGVSPTVSTMYDAAQVLARETRVWRLKRVHCQGTRSSGIDETVGDLKFTGRQRHSTRATAYVKYRVDDSPTAGFTLGNPAEWVWEAIPFSFVIDWAIPIGDYLASLTAMQGVTLVTGNVGVEYYFNATANTVREDWVTERAGTCEQIQRQRKVLYTIPMPDLPSLDLGMSPQRIMNAIALLTQLSGAGQSGSVR